jgi:hypothetical protein
MQAVALRAFNFDDGLTEQSMQAVPPRAFNFSLAAVERRPAIPRQKVERGKVQTQTLPRSMNGIMVKRLMELSARPAVQAIDV